METEITFGRNFIIFFERERKERSSMVAIVTTVRRSIQSVARFHLYEITSNFQRNNVEGEGEWKTVKAKGEWRWCLTVLCRALAHASAHYWQAGTDYRTSKMSYVLPQGTFSSSLLQGKCPAEFC